jgi:geranylgeranyl diphosphate synthase type II
MIHTMNEASASQKQELQKLLSDHSPDKVDRVLQLFRDCKADVWAESLKEKYFEVAMKHLEDIAVLASRKSELITLARYLLQRDS